MPINELLGLSLLVLRDVFCNSFETESKASLFTISLEAYSPCLIVSGITSISFLASSINLDIFIYGFCCNNISIGFLSICQSFEFQVDPTIVYGLLLI